MILYFQWVTWLIASFTFAVSLSVHDGYGFGPLVLLLLSFSLMFKHSKYTLQSTDKELIIMLVVYGVGMFGFVYLDGWYVRELDRPSRFLLAVPVLLLLLSVPAKKECLFYGAIIGAVSAFVLGFYERFGLHLGRAQGGEHPIMFGNTSLLLGLICFSAAFFFYSRRRWIWVGIAVISGVMGLGGSVLSASRGGWIALPLILFFLMWQSQILLGKRKILLIGFVALLVISAVVLIPQTGVKLRFEQAVHDIQRYQSGDLTENSVGQRFEMWKGAYILFKQSPIMGVGEYHAMTIKKDLVASGQLDSTVELFSHAHNEYIDALSLRGLAGFVLLMAIYLVPLRLFLQKMRQYPDNWNIKAYAMAGALVPMSYMDFALTQSMFSHNIGVMMYVFPIVYFWSAVRWAERDALAISSNVK